MSSIAILPHIPSYAAEGANMNCTLIVPQNPLSAQGLATPYQLKATNPDNGPCNEANPNQAAFVQAAVINKATGQISVYDPLVTDQNTAPAMMPTIPNLPANGVVGIWFGFNGMNLTLDGPGAGMCVNGANNSIFGQFAYCNALNFFAAANTAIRQTQAGLLTPGLTPPALGMSPIDRQGCPSVRDFSVVDQDQSDNVTTTYLVTNTGQTAQDTQNNRAALGNVMQAVNASDNRLIAVQINAALGCTAWMAPDLANPGMMTTALPLDELQAAATPPTGIILPRMQAGMQQGPQVGAMLLPPQPTAALVPAGDPMVLNNADPDLAKLNAYRRGVDQPQVQSTDQASTKTYCQQLAQAGPARLQVDQTIFMNQPSPNAMMANSLFTFMAQRFMNTFEANGLNCMNLLNQPDPVNVRVNRNGVAVRATITIPGVTQPQQQNPTQQENATPTPTGTGDGKPKGQYRQQNTAPSSTP